MFFNSINILIHFYTKYSKILFKTLFKIQNNKILKMAEKCCFFEESEKVLFYFCK